MVGNFIGDFVKGRNLLEQFEPDIVKGIELHRAIDEFTDNHPIVTLSKKRLWPSYSHYAAVIVDMYYDHLLAKNWNHYHPEPLEDFAAQAYKTAQHFEAVLPPRFNYMLKYMINGNWLVNYAKLEGLGRALSGMASRSKYESKMELAVNDLKENYELFSEEFATFFPELQAYTATWVNTTN